MNAGPPTRATKPTIALLVGTLVVLGALTVVRSHVWSPVDERGHYSVIQTWAEHHHPPRITDLNSPEVQAISDRTWPKPSPTDPRTLDLGGRNYEAFQPPLYYLLAIPAFEAVSDHRDKIFAVRTFDLALYLLGALLLWVLAGRISGDRPRVLPWAAGVVVLLWPGNLVRGITIANASLEYVLVPAFLLAAWEASTSRSSRWLIGAGVLLGLCLLTKVTLIYLAPCFAVAAYLSWKRSVGMRAVVLATVAPALLLAPWLLSNHERLGTWTANAAAQAQQTPFLYPHGVRDWTVGDLPWLFRRLLDGSVPQEWAGQLDVWWVGIGARLIILALPVMAIYAASVTDRRTVMAFFALPVVAALTAMVVTIFAQGWNIFLLRYFAPALAPLAMATAVALQATRQRVVASATLAAVLIVGLLWVDLAGAHYFADVGASLGIEAKP